MISTVDLTKIKLFCTYVLTKRFLDSIQFVSKLQIVEIRPDVDFGDPTFKKSQGY